LQQAYAAKVSFERWRFPFYDRQELLHAKVDAQHKLFFIYHDALPRARTVAKATMADFDLRKRLFSQEKSEMDEPCPACNQAA